MNKTLSVIKQEQAGTLERNKQIKKDYRLGLGGKIGREHSISRQAIHQIVHRTQQNQSGLGSRVMVFIKRLFRKKKRHIRIVSPLKRY